MSLTSDIVEELKNFADENKAIWLKNYMRNKFDFIGVEPKIRKKIAAKYSRNITSVENFRMIIKELWKNNYRECQYLAVDIVRKVNFEVDLNLIEFIITNKSWWDTVDIIAPNIVAHFFETNPKLRNKVITKWIKSNNIWLQRSCLIFQLKKKEKTDLNLLFSIIEELKDNSDFFIQKAIAWALREYSKTDADSIIDFISTNNFSDFVKREALRYLKQKGKI